VQTLLAKSQCRCIGNRCAFRAYGLKSHRARAVMKVVIVGAGIGGLAAALSLHKVGIEAEVYEQARELKELGVGINMLPHAIKELAALGLLPALDTTGIRTRALIYANRFGQTVWQELRGIDGARRAFTPIAASRRSATKEKRLSPASRAGTAIRRSRLPATC
jgi:2-polyprenyl-6-methoxyphenol hydroxylase-like FAD-dependent oxidoreductase